MSGIRFPMCCKNSAVLLSLLLLVGCQPPSNDNQLSGADNEKTDSALTIGTDSVTMSSDYVLNIKPSRYQPSLGLKGVTEPLKQLRFITTRDITVQKVLVKEGQWVEEGAPLLIVQRQLANDKAVSNDRKAETLTATDNGAKSSTTTANTTPVESPTISTQPEAKANKKTTETGLANNEPVDDAIDSANTVLSSGTENKIDTGQIDSSQTTDSQTNSSPINNNEAGAEQNAQNAKVQTSSASPIVIRAGFSGRIDSLYVQAGQQVDAREPLLQLSDDKNLRFIATLPIQAESQLSVGQTVNFTAQGLTEKFTGQVSKLAASDQPDKLQVYVDVVKNEVSRAKLKPNMPVIGRVDYGQIEVGAIVPERGIHDADLSVLQKPPYQSLMPLIANVWIIKQDQRLTRQPVEVIKYDPSTNQYLIAGVSNDSLIFLADLPKESVGKKVTIP